MVNLGVIGGGKWGQNHLRVYSEIDCNLFGLADISHEKKDLADKHNIKFETDYKHLFPYVDAVSVVTPTDSHYDVVKDCLLNGKHVLVEKPITLDSNKARELMDLAKKNNLILMVGYLFRFNAAVLKLKDLLKEIGDIQYITARYVHSNKPPRKDSGVVFNFVIHLIDILSFVLGKKPKKVFCKKLNYLSKEREDCAFATLDYTDFIANLEVSWFHPLKKRDMWIIGSKEKLYIDLFEQIIKRYPIEITLDKTIAGREINVEVNKNEPLKEELKYFCDCVKNNVEPLDASEEYESTKICEALLKSAETGEEVFL